MLDLDHLAQLDAALATDLEQDTRTVLPSFEPQPICAPHVPDTAARCPHLAARIAS